MGGGIGCCSFEGQSLRSLLPLRPGEGGWAELQVAREGPPAPFISPQARALVCCILSFLG